MLRLLLVRHAMCDGVGERLAGRTPGVRLNDVGRTQAQQLARLLAAETVDACITSPIERALQTATELAAPHSLQPRVCDAFTEIDFGDWTGRTIADLDGDPVWQDFNSMRGTTRIPGGELMIEVQARALAGVHVLQREYDGGSVIVVSHADVIRSLLVHLLGMPLDGMLRLDVATASVSTVELHGAWPRLISLNRTAA